MLFKLFLLLLLAQVDCFHVEEFKSQLSRTLNRLNFEFIILKGQVYTNQRNAEQIKFPNPNCYQKTKLELLRIKMNDFIQLVKMCKNRIELDVLQQIAAKKVEIGNLTHQMQHNNQDCAALIKTLCTNN